MRSLTMAISDGVQPSNEGRGYVLRRIARRALRYGHYTLGLPASNALLAPLVPVVVSSLGNAYPLIASQAKAVASVLEAEETAFAATLEKGVKWFNIRSQNMLPGHVVSGADVFFLYDSLGFPADLTQVMAREKVRLFFSLVRV